MREGRNKGTREKKIDEERCVSSKDAANMTSDINSWADIGTGAELC